MTPFDSKTKLEAALASMSDAVFISDAQGRFVDFNDAFATFHKFKSKADCVKTLDEYPGFLDVYAASGELLPVAQWAVPRALRGEKGTNVEFTLRRRDTGETWVGSYSYAPIRDATGAIVGAVVTGRDITELKRAEAARVSLEAQLRESQKMQAIGTLAGGIAHDFNNIISIILGNADLALQETIANRSVVESLEEIRNAGRRARDLVHQILSFSRRQPVERKPTALAPVLEESVRLLRATLPARVALSVHCDADVPLVLANTTQIEQVVINLAANAMQAVRGRSGTISIRLDTILLDAALLDAFPALRELHDKHPGRAARLAVSDDGQGIDAATLERIFEPFFTTKPAGEGTGLGLSVVHGIVQAHEGAILVASEVDKGTTFTIYLPLVEGEVAATAPEVIAAAPVKARRDDKHVLYLDDEKALVYLVERLLRRRGYRASGFTSPLAALAALRADPDAFDLVVTDHNMPGMSGLEVARAVRAIRADLTVAVVSGFIDEELQANADAAGVRELIPKASDAREMIEAFSRLVLAAEVEGEGESAPKNRP